MKDSKQSYVTRGGLRVMRTVSEVAPRVIDEELPALLDAHRGGLLAGSYEYPGRYKRWDLGFVNPPLEVSSREGEFAVRALNERGAALLPLLAGRLRGHEHLRGVTARGDVIWGSVRP